MYCRNKNADLKKIKNKNLDCYHAMLVIHWWKTYKLTQNFCLFTVVNQDGVYVLDMAAKIDGTADYICKAKWGDLEFPPPFGREAYPEVRFEEL